MTDHYRDCIETLPDGTTRDNCADESHAIVYGKKTNAGERGGTFIDLSIYSIHSFNSFIEFMARNAGR